MIWRAVAINFVHNFHTRDHH